MKITSLLGLLIGSAVAEQIFNEISDNDLKSHGVIDQAYLDKYGEPIKIG